LRSLSSTINTRPVTTQRHPDTPETWRWSVV
jgi:hypothetical protein